MTGNFPSTTAAPETLLMMAPASDTPDLEICSAPNDSVEAAALARSARSCLMVLGCAAEAKSLGGTTTGGGSATRITGAFEAAPEPPPEGPVVCLRWSTKKLSPAAAGASDATARRLPLLACWGTPWLMGGSLDGGGWARGCLGGSCVCFLSDRTAVRNFRASSLPFSVVDTQKSTPPMTTVCTTIEMMRATGSFFGLERAMGNERRELRGAGQEHRGISRWVDDES